jgi:hypothetical protein
MFNKILETGLNTIRYQDIFSSNTKRWCWLTE